MAHKTKADIVEQVTQNVRRKIDLSERTVSKSDIRLVINSFIEELRTTVIEGDTVALRGLVSIWTEERSSIVSQHFGKKNSGHTVNSWTAIKIVPHQSFKDAVKERYRSEKNKKE